MEPLNSIPAILRRISMAVSILIMLVSTVWLLILWPKIPDTVPVSFAADGTPNGYDGRLTLLAPLIVGWIVVALFIVLEFFPQFWNIPGKGNGFRVSVGKFGAASNGAQATPGAIASMRNMMAVDRIMAALLFSVISISSAKCRDLPVGAMISIFAIMFVASVFFSIQASRRNSR